jgi:ergothioneine biosynthesis protein EgtB
LSETVRTSDASASALAAQYQRVRDRTEALCRPLALDDYGVQPMADASPPKWHLAHTTWFFETFLLKTGGFDYTPFHPDYEYLFNSYYNSVGEPYPRDQRGRLSRPTVAQVMAYRQHVDRAMHELLERERPNPETPDTADTVLLGLNHEQQHQELILTDLKYNLGRNPLQPAYREDLAASGPANPVSVVPQEFLEFEAADIEVGATAGFCFDHELPRHRVHVGEFALADRLVSNHEYLAFIEDDGYRRPELWLSDAWAALRSGARQSPLYWTCEDGDWHEYGLAGRAPLNGAQPVVHVNYYEAAAYASWCGARLPTEFEWERAALGAPVRGNFVESDLLTPIPATGTGLRQLFGDVWEWTASGFAPYPGFKPGAGALGEYNGKFMSSQMVLRGGSCATPEGHVRASYRNFFYPGDQWQFSGLRLARDPERELR